MIGVLAFDEPVDQRQNDQAVDRQADDDNSRSAFHFLTRAIEADHRNAEAWRLRARLQFRGTSDQMAGGLIDTFVAAGSTINKEVPSDALAVARPRQRNVEGWVSRRGGKGTAKEEAGSEGKRKPPEEE